MATLRKWSVSIEQWPGQTVARFSYESPQLGHQIWDEMVWPLSVEEWTEAAILAELYAALIDFWSTRK